MVVHSDVLAAGEWVGAMEKRMVALKGVEPLAAWSVD